MEITDVHETPGRLMQRTTQLRMLVDENGNGRLQQAWAPVMGGQIEWHDVETVFEEATNPKG